MFMLCRLKLCFFGVFPEDIFSPFSSLLKVVFIMLMVE